MTLVLRHLVQCVNEEAYARLLAAYRVSSQRGAPLSGVVVHDHCNPNFAMEEVEHFLCNAHNLRELQALVDIEGRLGLGGYSNSCAGSIAPPGSHRTGISPSRRGLWR